MLADRTYDEDVIATTAIGRSLGTDYFGLRDELTEAERDYLKRHPHLRRRRGAARHQRLLGTGGVPVGAHQEDERTLGIIGDGIEGYGCPPMSPVAARTDPYGAEPR